MSECVILTARPMITWSRGGLVLVNCIEASNVMPPGGVDRCGAVGPFDGEYGFDKNDSSPAVPTHVAGDRTSPTLITM